MSATRKAAGAEPALHRPHEVARTLGCSEWWVKERARRREIPFSWIGGSYRFTDEHVTEIIRIFEVRPTTTGPHPGTPPSAVRAPRRRPKTPPAAPAVVLRARPPARTRRAAPGPSAA